MKVRDEDSYHHCRARCCQCEVFVAGVVHRSRWMEHGDQQRGWTLCSRESGESIEAKQLKPFWAEW